MTADRRRVLFFAWLPAVLYMALIWLMSSFALPALPIASFPLRDKGLHMLEYAGLAFFVAHATRRSWPGHSSLRLGALAVVVTVAWGIFDELHQAFVPGRSPDALDLVADVVGAVCGAVARTALAHLYIGRLVRSG